MFKHVVHIHLLANIRVNHLVDFRIVSDRIHLDENVPISIKVWNTAAQVTELFIDLYVREYAKVFIESYVTIAQDKKCDSLVNSEAVDQL